MVSRCPFLFPWPVRTQRRLTRRHVFSTGASEQARKRRSERSTRATAGPCSPSPCRSLVTASSPPTASNRRSSRHRVGRRPSTPRENCGRGWRRSHGAPPSTTTDAKCATARRNRTAHPTRRRSPSRLRGQGRPSKCAAALDALPGEEREVVRLAHYEQMPHTEIATKLGIPVGTVTSTSHRAQRRLATLLADMGDAAR